MVILPFFCIVMKLLNPTLYWLICGVYSDFHVIEISFATKIAHTKKNCFSLFSLSQLPILTESWLVYHFPKNFQKQWLNTLEDLLVCVCHKNVTDVSASGRTLASCLQRQLESLPVQGSLEIHVWLRAVVGDPTLSYFMSEIPVEPFAM